MGEDPAEAVLVENDVISGGDFMTELVESELGEAEP